MPSSRVSAASVTLAFVLAASASTAALAQGAPEVARNPKTGLVSWMSGDAGRPVASADGPVAAASFEQAATAFLSAQQQAFGLRTGASELAVRKTSEDGAGNGFVRFQQTYQGLPIIGAELVVQLDAGRNVLSVNARSVGDLALSTQPSVSAADAAKSAVSSTARAHDVSLVSLKASEPTLSVHDARVMGGPPAPPALVWRVDVTSAAHPEIEQVVLVDAQNGRVAVTFNQSPNAAPKNATQRVCDAANSVSKVPCGTSDGIANPGSSAVSDVKLAFKYAESTYDFYARRFDRNSLDGKGLTLVSTVRFQRTSGQDYQNAFWSSDLGQMVYGKDFATAEDVVGHELSHGFTSFTSGLFYFYQSGALNESLSDIFGELVQRSNDTSDGWLLGEDLPVGAIRNMKDPTKTPNPQFSLPQPDKMTSTLWTGDFSGVDRGGVHTNSGVGNKAAYLLTDGDTFNGQTIKGLGIDKTAAIFFRVNAFLLSSSSDYADFGNAMKQACKDLIGSKPRNKKGNTTSAITSTDCQQVAKVVTATEMYKDPQYWPIPAEAVTCPSGKSPSDKLFEKFEASDPSKFKFAGEASHWALIDVYAASNTHSVFGGGSGQYDTSFTQTSAVSVPNKAYLRFAHYYNLYTNSSGSHAGGVIEYSVKGGAWKTVPSSMFLDNPYNATLVSGSALGGQKAFSGFSGGWTSSRIDLSSLAGKSVKFRFRLATDFNGAFDGWIVDDIRVYSCTDSKADIAAR